MGAVKIRYNFEGRNLYPLGEFLGESVHSGGYGALRILREHRDDHQLGGPDVVLQILFPTVVHFIYVRRREQECMVDLDVALGIDLLQFVPYAVGEILGVGDQGKALSVPNSFVELGGFGGSERKDEAVENDLPLPCGNVDDPWVAKKVAQVFAQSLRGRCLGGTKLHEDNLGLALRRYIGVAHW